MRRITGVLALCAILLGLAGAHADTITQRFNFQTTQSLWNTTDTLKASRDLTGRWDEITFHPEAGFYISGLGHFSVGVDGAVRAGRAGLIATAYADGGTVTVKYPMTLTMTYPDPKTLKAGQSFQITSSWTPGAGNANPSLTTKSPKLGAKIEGVLKGGLDIDLALRAFGEWWRPSLIHRSVDFCETLLDTQNISAGKHSYKGILSFEYTQPKINLTNVPAPYSPDLFAIGNTPNADNYSGIPGFFLLEGNISNAIGYVVGMATNGEPIKFSDDLDYTFLDAGFTGSYNFASLIAAAGVGLQEEVRFKPIPKITLYITGTNGTSTVEFPAGGSTSVTMPADGSGISLDPVVSLDNTFYNRLTCFGSADLSLFPFDFTARIHVPGYSSSRVGDSVSPIRLATTSADLGDLYNETFKLGFDPLSGKGVYLVPPVVKNTPLVANDDYYTAYQTGGIKGPVWRVLAGYVNTPAGPISNDTGPAGFDIVPQRWQPDPNDPDTYLTINQNGSMDFSVSQAIVNSGIGQFSRTYQIKDRKGNLVTGHIYITVGGGG